MFDADFALVIRWADCKCHALAQLLSLFLKWGCCAQGGVESQVKGFALRRPGLNIASPFAFCSGPRTPARFLSGQSVQRTGYLARGKILPDLDFFSPFPPVSAACI